MQNVSRKDRNILNPETLLVEMDTSSRHTVLKGLGVLAAGAALFALYLWLCLGVFHITLPKTAMLRGQAEAWRSRIQRLDARMDNYEQVMSLLEMRDNRIYRPVFGMSEISAMERVGAPLKTSPGTPVALEKSRQRCAALLHREAVQGSSYDEVERLARTAGDMATHIPAIPPVNPDPKTYRFSSPFGYRVHPIFRRVILHKGIDFGCDKGNPIYATGDGTVVTAEYNNGGYGYQVILDHGFGYQSRYAHMSVYYVYEGQKVKRGDCIGLVGSTGRSTGPHLHYEVMYRGEVVDPLHFMDLSLSPKDYFNMVRKPSTAKK